MEAKSRSRTWPYTCGLKDSEGGPHLVRRARLPPEEVELFVRQVEEALGSAGGARVGAPVAVIGPAGPARSAGDDTSGPNTIGVEVRVPIARGTPPPEGFESVEIDSVPVAYTVHHGASGGLAAAEEILSGWIRLKALKAMAEVRRVYLKRGTNPRKHVTEVQVPLER